MARPAGGKPAKGREEIRATLDSIHQAEVPGHEAGPLNAGLNGEARLPIASFSTASTARDFQQVLLNSGVMSELMLSRRRTQVAVDMSDRQRAVELLNGYRAEHPEVASTIKSRRYDKTILLGMVGAGVGITYVIAMGFLPSSILPCLACIAIGFLLGLLLDTPEGPGGFYWSLRALLVVVTLAALCLYLGKVLQELKM